MIICGACTELIVMWCVSSVFSMSHLLNILRNANYIDEVTVMSVREFLLSNDTSTTPAAAALSTKEHPPKAATPVLPKKVTSAMIVFNVE